MPAATASAIDITDAGADAGAPASYASLSSALSPLQSDPAGGAQNTPADAAADALRGIATAETLYLAGLAHADGIGVEADRIEAHKWFNLAALKGHEDAAGQRSAMAGMIGKSGVRLALKRARNWLAEHG